MCIFIFTLLLLLYDVKGTDMIFGKKFGSHWTLYEKGIIPSNALEAGTEFNKTIYIGLAFYSLNLYVGKIVDGRPYVEFIYNDQTIEQDHYVSIFTTNQPHSYTWAPVVYKNIVLSKHLQPVRIGMLGGKYVARGGKIGKQTVGTLNCEQFPSNCDALEAVNRNGELQLYYNFEILVREP